MKAGWLVGIAALLASGMAHAECPALPFEKPPSCHAGGDYAACRADFESACTRWLTTSAASRGEVVTQNACPEKAVVCAKELVEVPPPPAPEPTAIVPRSLVVALAAGADLVKESEFGFVDDPKAAARVSALLDVLCPALGLDKSAITVRFLGTKKITKPRNLAAATFDGHLYVEEAYLHAVPPPSDDELAFVIAHELGHVRGHHAELALAELGLDHANVGELDTKNPRVRALAEQAAHAQESAPRETEADEAAIDALVGAKRSTHGMEEFFNRTSKLDKRSGSIADEKLYDHPATEARRAHLEERLKALSAAAPTPGPTSRP